MFPSSEEKGASAKQIFFHPLLPAGYLSQYVASKLEQEKQLCCLLVDSGYSFTHIVPYYCGKKIGRAVHRLDLHILYSS